MNLLRQSIICMPPQIAFVYTHKRVGQVIVVTTAVILLGLTAVLYTPAGFPYSGTASDMSPQRAMLVVSYAASLKIAEHSFVRIYISVNKGYSYWILLPLCLSENFFCKTHYKTFVKCNIEIKIDIEICSQLANLVYLTLLIYLKLRFSVLSCNYCKDGYLNGLLTLLIAS